MTNDTLDSHLQIRFGMEDQSTKKKCSTCVSKLKVADKDPAVLTEIEVKASKQTCTCHCALADISEEMVGNCAEAWRGTKQGEDDSDDDEEEFTNAEVPDERLK